MPRLDTDRSVGRDPDKAVQVSTRIKQSWFLAALVVVALMGSSLPAIAEDGGDFTAVFPQDPLVTRFTNSWGDARSAGRAHRGTDLMAPKGSAVYAIADGTVTIAKSGDRAGRWVAIDHGGGWESWYMHLNNDNPGTDDGDAPWALTLASGVAEGEWVMAGELLGWVGDSGNAEPSSPHTHFELHRNGVAINPYPYLQAAYERALVEAASAVLPALSDLINEMGSIPLRPVRPLG